MSCKRQVFQEENLKKENKDEIMTTIRLKRKTYIEVKKKLLEQNKSFKDWVNTKMEEYLENGNKKNERN